MKRSTTRPDDGQFWLMLIDNDPDLIALGRVAAQIQDILFCPHLHPDSAYKMLEQAHYKMSAIVVDLKLSPYQDGIGVTAQIIRNQEIRGIGEEDRIPIFWYTGVDVDEELERIAKRYCVLRIFQKGAFTPLEMLIEIQLMVMAMDAEECKPEM